MRYLFIIIIQGFKLIVELKELIETFNEKSKSTVDILKTGRSNGEFIDLPIKKMYTNWQEYLEPFIKEIDQNLNNLNVIPLGSKIETEIESLKELVKENNENEKIILDEINKYYQGAFQSSTNRLNSLAQFSPIVNYSGTLNSLATVIMKIANDIRFLSSGPRSGFGELNIPENEPGSSIMPGKVNPTQCESLTMVAAQVIGNHNSISIANSCSMFESNAFKPLMANNILRNIRLLCDGLRSFRLNCAVGIEIVESKIKENLTHLI